jgi:hypothetical protein
MSPKKLFLSFVSLFVLVSLPLIGSVSASSELWSQTYGGDGMDACTSMVQTADGGFVLFGFAHSFGTYAWLVKTDADGNMQWNRTIAGASSFIQTLDSGFAFVGTNAASIDGYIPVGYLPDGFWSHVWLAKTDAYGNMEWNQTFDEEVGCYYGSSLVQTEDGGYALLGDSFSSFGDYDDVLLIKTDSYGNKEWSRLYNYSEQERGSDLIQTLDEGFTFIRKTYSSSGGFTGFMIIKTDATGNVKWNQTYLDLNMAGVSSFVQLSDGSFVLSGNTYSSGDRESEFYLTKLDKNGNVEWSQTYRTHDSERSSLSSVVQTSDGGFALAGYSVNLDDDLWADFVLIKTDNRGNMHWNQTYSGGALLGYPSILQTSDGGFALSGGIGSFDTQDWDFWLIKTDSQGIPEFTSGTAILLSLAAFTVALAICKQKLSKPKEVRV